MQIDPRQFTVQIRHSIIGNIIGTGFVIDSSGIVVTCRHVLHASGTGDTLPNKATVYFPQEDIDQKATGKLIESYGDEDLALLQVSTITFGSHHVAPLGDPMLIKGDEFEAYGYSKTHQYHANIAIGNILGYIEKPYEYPGTIDPIQLKSDGLDKGMSGAAIISLNQNKVVGVAMSTYYADQTLKKRDNAYGISIQAVLQMISKPLTSFTGDLQQVVQWMQAKQFDDVITYVEALQAEHTQLEADFYYYRALATLLRDNSVQAVVYLRNLLKQYPGYQPAKRLLRKISRYYF